MVHCPSDDSSFAKCSLGIEKWHMLYYILLRYRLPLGFCNRAEQIRIHGFLVCSNPDTWILRVQGSQLLCHPRRLSNQNTRISDPYSDLKSTFCNGLNLNWCLNDKVLGRCQKKNQKIKIYYQTIIADVVIRESHLQSGLHGT